MPPCNPKIDWKTIPKADMHVHLEGSMQPGRVLQLAENYTDHPWHLLNYQDLESLLTQKGFFPFLQNFKTGYQLLRSTEDYQKITEDLCATLEEQGAIGADILYSPGPAIQKWGVSLTDIHSGIELGLGRFPKLKIRLILDTVLNLGVDFMSTTLDQVLNQRPDHLAGFSIGGGLPDLDLTPFLFLFEKAQRAGLFSVAHCGEIDSPENILTLIQETDIQRIVHGVRAVENPVVLDKLKQKRIPIDVCLTSNIRTGVVTDFPTHPIHTFLEKGIQFTINTDDPFYFQTSLMEEYQLCESLLGVDATLEAASRSENLCQSPPC